MSAWRPPYLTDFAIAYGSSGGGSQSSTQQVILPEWVQGAAMENIQKAKDVANLPYQANPFNIVAPLSADQTQAYDTVRGAQGMADPAYAAAMGTTSGLLGQAKPITTEQINTDTKSLLNPYSDIVIDPSLALMGQELNKNINTTRANAANVGAFGGSRLGVAEGTAISDEALQAGKLKAGLLSSAYDTAQKNAIGLAGQNQDLGQWATSLLPTLGQNQVTERLKEAGLLERAGMAEQGQEQAVVNAMSEGWQDQYNYPLTQLEIQESALAATPYGSTTVSTGPATSRNRTAGALGGAASGASMGAMFGPWGAAIGGVAGGLLGAFG